MARGDHPERTPFYGGCLIVAAMLLGTAVQIWFAPPVWVRAPVLVLALAMALVGLAFTLRDRTPPRRRRP